MPLYSTPGVYVGESQLTSLTQPATGPTAAVFLGEAPRGPVGPTLVTDWPTFKLQFGDLDNAYDLCYSVYHYFANGGRSAYVIRVLGAASTANSSASGASIGLYDGGASVALGTFAANSPGAWGNGIKLTVAQGAVTASSAAKPTFNLAVSLSGTEVEQWKELAVDENSNRYFVEMINRYSKFISVSAPASYTYSTVAPASGASFIATAITDRTMTGGSATSPTTTTYSGASGIDLIDTIQGNLIINAVGLTDTTAINLLAAKCKTRGDSFLIVDPKLTDTTQAMNASTVGAITGSTAPGYMSIYTPCLEMVDPLKTGLGAARTTFPGGAVAGVFVRTELARSVAKAPAGYDCTIVGALGISVKYTDSQVGAMYDAAVQSNSFKAIPGAGVAIMGARTVEKVNPDRFVPVRRTLNYVKRSVKDIAAAYVFEPNDANLWIKLNNDISNFLNNFWRSGGLKGARSSDAFFVVCDKTNNTASSIDQGIVNVSIGIAVTYPAEFIVINVSQWTGGSNAVEINL